jgi:hypothetical protein
MTRKLEFKFCPACHSPWCSYDCPKAADSEEAVLEMQCRIAYNLVVQTLVIFRLRDHSVDRTLAAMEKIIEQQITGPRK